ncbi:TPA: hypothetical protein DIU27_02405 [Candidatus Collierbacteria bacterium]|uniref:UbiA prenyltransferase n=1 Tax=Candidatus Collierbacteria bacterium GW2011_GWB2_44_22 TaxID=1618387 RepID=A0A0G1HYC7_9BACT|nr:MAG: hypothetical protein UW44_C0005G0002 [Candidatus Collierbacteria bacterium GW2011_GWB2_44_22]KKT69444.1 MAG: hypothetical protein UW64_C0001G0090 [Microgenomates group bacterium GW2011_GWC1_44_37]KKT89752.1 MAG: hypothetical protein UW88_C0001G0132 [Candidatus Collierbacteria bacterium GW2011_GWD2_45_10]HCQ31211.1 hypothetical protein [Candidatus Collierbacteria bacterium]
MKLWTEIKPYFNRTNLLIGFMFGLFFVVVSVVSLGRLTWPALALLAICTVGAPLFRYRDVELEKNFKDRL